MLLYKHSYEVAIAALKIWQVPKTKHFPEGIKYSLFLVNKITGEVLIGYDNHKPKGHHVHMDSTELPYRFYDRDTLIEDFWTNVKKRRIFTMKIKKAKIVVQSLTGIKKEWSSALKGKTKSPTRDDTIIVTGLETIAKIFSKSRMQILQAIIAEKPDSIYVLAKIVDRDFKNVYADVQFLNAVGLIKLKETGTSRKGLKPVAKYSGIELDLAA